MSRLIDIDDERFWDVLFDEACVEGNQAEQIKTELEKIVAFDTEKVVEQLEEMKSLSEDAVDYEKRHGSIEDRLKAESSLKELNRVIDIVKKGGVE